MNARWLLPILLLAMLVVAPSVATACPNCADAASKVIAGPGDDPAAAAEAARVAESTRNGYETSILLMIISVLSLVGLIVVMIVRTVRRVDAASAARMAAPSTSPPTPSH